MVELIAQTTAMVVMFAALLASGYMLLKGK